MAALTVTNEALDDAELGVDVTPSLTDANRPDYILVEDEIMAVSAGTSTLTVTRGAYGTAAVAHNTAKDVFEVTRVDTRADSLLVYYVASDGSQSAKKIVVAGDAVIVEAGTSLDFNFAGPADLTDNTTGAAGATLPAIRTDSLANAAADIRVCIASLNKQINDLNDAVEAASVTAS